MREPIRTRLSQKQIDNIVNKINETGLFEWYQGIVQVKEPKPGHPHSIGQLILDVGYVGVDCAELDNTYLESESLGDKSLGEYHSVLRKIFNSV